MCYSIVTIDQILTSHPTFLSQQLRIRSFDVFTSRHILGSIPESRLTFSISLNMTSKSSPSTRKQIKFYVWKTTFQNHFLLQNHWITLPSISSVFSFSCINTFDMKNSLRRRMDFCVFRIIFRIFDDLKVKCYGGLEGSAIFKDNAKYSWSDNIRLI